MKSLNDILRFLDFLENPCFEMTPQIVCPKIGTFEFLIEKFRCYSSNQITKKEPKSEARVSKFDGHDLSPIKYFRIQKPIKHPLLAIR